MTIALRCPGCTAQLRVRDDFARREVKCPRCGRLAHVPAESAEAVEIHVPLQPVPQTVPGVPCPRCGTPDPLRIKWTLWGSFYGPALFHHVACRQCGYTYNSRTGGSNRIVIALFTAIPLFLIGVIIGIIGVVLWRL